jgi:hypothetical protein
VFCKISIAAPPAAAGEEEGFGKSKLFFCFVLEKLEKV